jgi:hypothetical protein
MWSILAAASLVVVAAGVLTGIWTRMRRAPAPAIGRGRQVALHQTELAGGPRVMNPAPVEPREPPGPETDVVRFRFRESPSRAQTAPGLAPELGELLYERKTGRSVYRYWEPSKAAAVKLNGPDRIQTPLTGAAAFDGQSYWAAAFDRREYARRIVVYKDDDELRKYDGIDMDFRWLPSWYHWAPLHALAATVGSEAIHRDDLHHAIQTFPRTSALAPRIFSVNPMHTQIWPPPVYPVERDKPSSTWNYTVKFDDSDVGIESVEVNYLHIFNGFWPLPVPENYTMVRENAGDIEAADLSQLVDSARYADESTAIEDSTARSWKNTSLRFDDFPRVPRPRRGD